MIRQEETWKAFIVANQAHYNQTNESRFNLVELTPEERGWTELFQIYPPKNRTGGTGISPVNGRSYSWTYGFLPVGYFGAKNQSRVFTKTETWICPADVNEIYVRCVGKGANGNASSGGGGGGFIMAKISVVPGTSYAITIDSAASSFGGVISALAASGSTGGSFTHNEDIEVLFKGQGGDASLGGGGGGSELGKGGKGSSGGGGGGLHSGIEASSGRGGCGMLSASIGDGGAGFMSNIGSSGTNTGKGMFSSDVGLKSNTSPYYNKLSVDITENLGTWGTPNNYGGGTNGSAHELMFSGGNANIYDGGGFGGGGGVEIRAQNNIVVGGDGGYGGGGGFGRNTSSYDYGYGGYGGSGGGGGRGAGMSGGGRGGGGDGGYGGGGGSGGSPGGNNYGIGGKGLVILEW